MGIIITLMICGGVLLVLESVLPGMILGVFGIVCWGGAVVYGYSELGPEAGHITFASVLLFGVVGFLLWLKYFPSSPFGKIFVSDSHVGDLGEKPDEILGAKGRTSSRLSPSGYARIQNKKYDVIAAEGFLEPDTAIEVIDVSGNRIIVRKASEENSETQAQA